jgi:hypothetical protein
MALTGLSGGLARATIYFHCGARNTPLGRLRTLSGSGKPTRALMLRSSNSRDWADQRLSVATDM